MIDIVVTFTLKTIHLLVLAPAWWGHHFYMFKIESSKFKISKLGKFKVFFIFLMKFEIGIELFVTFFYTGGGV